MTSAFQSISHTLLQQFHLLPIECRFNVKDQHYFPHSLLLSACLSALALYAHHSTRSIRLSDQSVLRPVCPHFIRRPQFQRCSSWNLKLSPFSSSNLYQPRQSSSSPYLHNLISVQHPGTTRSSPVVTLARPLTSSSLKITDLSFRYASPCLWNQLPLSLRQPHSGTSSPISDSPILHPSLLPLFIHLSAHP